MGEGNSQVSTLHWDKLISEAIAEQCTAFEDEKGSEAMFEQLGWRPRRAAKQTLVCHALCHRKKRELPDKPVVRSLEKACPLVE